jgi:deazaflavin-dependent oxidoreductase (nitroreductase family)
MSEFEDLNTRIIAEFRANHGKVGGNFEGAPMVLVHTTGARTGAERVNPLMYLPDGDRYLIFASKGGADTHPAWYRNLLAHPDIEIEVGDETIPVHAEELKGAERDEKYAEQARRYPGFAEYQKKTSRVIPVIALTRR